MTGTPALVEATRRLLRHKTAWAVGVLAVVLEGALFWWWLSLPLGTRVQVASVALMAAVMIGSAAALLWQAFTLFSHRGRPASWWKGPTFWLALLIAIIAGGVLPWMLLHWIIAFPQLEAQAVSFALRALASDILVCGALLWLSAVISVIREDDGKAR